MKIPNTTTDYQTSLDILREQRQIRRERFFSSPGLIMGLTVFILIVMAAIIIPAVANVDPNAMAIADRLKGPSLKHPFGTDEFGRDLMIRVLYGARVSLLAGGTVALLSCALGTVIGIYASYFKILDHILMRICEGLIAIPGVLLAIALMAALGAGNLNVIIALTIVYTPSVARIVRSSALVTREQPYVEAAKVQGAGSGRILRKLILPGVISPLTVQASFIFAQAIISEASLSFLGAGIPAPAASWGNILQGSKQVLQKAPWTVIFPGLAVVLCVLSLNLLGDGLRDYLDPRTAGRKKR
ncbi:ABC transporter permease [Enterocloster clostridioformis]|uniref:ABC transporter permease n=1 Tax=Enterocloster clostridioformis TaxID=1531 RepID=UPI00080C8EE4|nr:ABC transporter permease [Enterocloster clostridioformis]ANU46091.1 peptide ABC transporter permease [Lachnoclostridium sp. YL32]MCI7610208.1 ABC transporter permease [Enterocloster clostridioformis]NDO30043.1 ABC transporter permease [Enterocloster clostridioformis]OXE67411.1 ABC transporter permease [Enterocloster clostridioformis]QQQ99159.1 ABC transporter permease [Enterocloster clostridioformis]